MITNPIPYNNLTPSLILDAIESIGYKCSGSLLALNSYENRVYQIGLEDSPPIIAKFYRPNRWSNNAIYEEHQFAKELLEHEIPIIAPLINNQNQTLHEYFGFCFAVFPRQGGRALELENIENLAWMGRFLGRLHAIGACKPFRYRIKIDVQTYGYQPYHFLIKNNFIPEELKQSYCSTVKILLEKIEEYFQQLESIKYIRLHGDCHAGNILWNDNGPRIVDLDDCLMGPAIQDIWMLISGNTKYETDLQLSTILNAYCEFYNFDYQEIYLIEALRTLRLIHYSGWLARRWKDPAFPINFPWFNTLSYWKEQLQNLNEQLLLLDKQINTYF